MQERPETPKLQVDSAGDLPRESRQVDEIAQHDKRKGAQKHANGRLALSSCGHVPRQEFHYYRGLPAQQS